MHALFHHETTRKIRTGLGLSISYNIIQQHGGHMRFESKEGEYTTAILELPVCEEESEHA